MKSKQKWQPELGAQWQPQRGAAFCVWGPLVRSMRVKILRGPLARTYPMQRDERGYFRAVVPDARVGDRYVYALDGEKERPDPVSRYQPEGVHGPTAIVDPQAFKWQDSRWRGRAHPDLVFYELHTGTFTSQGTFDAVIPKIPYLKKLGITCLEIMPVAQFPGKRNWGYDGVSLYAVQNSYGGPAGLKRLVQACHRQGMAVCLDVVYNHLGPEGNYLHDYGPYFTPQYKTPWGDAINYDDQGCAEVRRFVIDNALFWITEYHLDVLRLDAIHSIYDKSDRHILAEMAERVQAEARRLGREVAVIAESDLNDTRMVEPRAAGGYGLDAQWSDDFHHAVHAQLTGEKSGYYQDFSGMGDIVKAVRDGFVYDGIYSAFRKRRHGYASRHLPGMCFVVCLQNHDQVGNGALGDRLSHLISFAEQKMSAALLCLNPYLPFLFMGQEFGSQDPFQYFVDHSDPQLLEAVRQGRQKEFRAFGWTHVPDPADPATFRRSRLSWARSRQKKGRQLFALYRDLLRLRRRWHLSGASVKKNMRVLYEDGADWFGIVFPRIGQTVPCVFFSFSKQPRMVKLPMKSRAWKKVLGTDDTRYGGHGAKVRQAGGKIRLAPESALALEVQVP